MKEIYQNYLVKKKFKVSISPTFYARIFCTKVLHNFLYLHSRFKLFLMQEYWLKYAHKMLVKLTKGVHCVEDILEPFYKIIKKLTKIWEDFFCDHISSLFCLLTPGTSTTRSAIHLHKGSSINDVTQFLISIPVIFTLFIIELQ